MEPVDWAKMLALIATPAIQEDRLEIRTEAEALQPGDQVVVTTKVGRTMISGVVTSVDNSTVTIRSEQDRIRSFPADLYNFLKVTIPEDKNEIDEVHLGRPVSAPEPGSAVPAHAAGMKDSPVQIADLGPLPITHPGTQDDTRPAIKIISKYISGDARWANEIWSDMTSIGAVRSMRKHSIGADTMGNIVADLKLNKLYSEE